MNASRPPMPTLARLAAIGFVTAWPAMASALTWVEAGAADPLTGEVLQGDTRTMPDLAGAPAVYGRTGINVLLLDPWSFGKGPLPPACPGLFCAATSGTAAFGAASADADAGVLKGGASAVGNGVGEARAVLEDTLSIGGGGASLHLDLRVDGWRAENEGASSYTFQLGRYTGDEDFPIERWVRLEVSGSGDWDLFVADAHSSGSAFGGRVEMDWLFPGSGLAGINYSLDVFASLEVRADCALASNLDGNTCRAGMDASHSSYLGLRGDAVSLSGYAWRGVAPPVPEPETWAMMLAGLGLLGAMGRRRGAPA